jgi:hypothetical protein
MPSSRLRAQIHHSMALNFSRVSQSVMEPMLGERKVACWIGSGEPGNMDCFIIEFIF